MCRERDLPVGGRKAELIARLSGQEDEDEKADEEADEEADVSQSSSYLKLEAFTRDQLKVKQRHASLQRSTRQA